MDKIFLFTIFIFVLITILLIVDVFSYKKRGIKSSLGVRFMMLKVFLNRKSIILYISFLCFSFFILLLTWNLMKIFTFNYYYSFWVIVFITFVSFLVLQNYLILFSTKIWNLTNNVSFVSESTYDTLIEIYDKDKQKVSEKIKLFELITYLKVFYEGMSLLLALFIIGLSIDNSIDKSYVYATHLSYGLCIFIPLISLKLHEQRFKVLKEKE